MSAKEFLLKTCLFIILPGLVIYGCLRENERLTREQVACRACLQALHSSTVKEMTVVGHADDGRLVYKPTADTTALRTLRILAKGLRPVRVQPGGYRPSLRRYSLVLNYGRDTCELVIYKMPVGEVDLLDIGTTTAYEAPKFIPFLDSLFRALPPNQGENALRADKWLSK